MCLVQLLSEEHGTVTVHSTLSVVEIHSLPQKEKWNPGPVSLGWSKRKGPFRDGNVSANWHHFCIPIKWGHLKIRGDSDQLLLS